MTTAIAKLEHAERLLAEAKTLDDIKAIRDIAKAAEAYARAARLGRENENRAAEVRLFAERKAGEMLSDMKEMGTRHNGHGDQKSEGKVFPPKLEDLGVTKTESKKWQALAELPEPVFREAVEQGKQERLTDSAVMNAVKAKRSEKKKQDAAASLKSLHAKAASIPEDARARVLEGDVFEQIGSIPSNSVHLIVTSPPYPGVPEKWGDLFAEFHAAHAWLDRVWDECIRVLVPGGKLAINIGDVGRHPLWPNGARVMLYQNPDAELIANYIWDQQSESGNTAWGTFANPTNPHACDDHEYIIVFQKRGVRQSPIPSGQVLDEKEFMTWRRSIWRMKTASATKEHHTAPFPAELPHRLILLYSFPGETVLDPFLGSGTTLVEARRLDRVAIGIEKDADYVRLARAKIS